MDLQNTVHTPRAAVLGAGGFIGGHLVRGLQQRGIEVIRAVDIKPIDEWYQGAHDVENLALDLSDRQNCLKAVRGADHVYQLAADMGGMGFIQNNKALCMLNVLPSTNALIASAQCGATRYFTRLQLACTTPISRRIRMGLRLRKMMLIRRCLRMGTVGRNCSAKECAGTLKKISALPAA
jgi:hypothetical protein